MLFFWIFPSFPVFQLYPVTRSLCAMCGHFGFTLALLQAVPHSRPPIRSGQADGMGCPLEEAHGKRSTVALERGLGPLDRQLGSPGHEECDLEGKVWRLSRHIIHRLPSWWRRGSEQEPPKTQEPRQVFLAQPKDNFAPKTPTKKKKTWLKLSKNMVARRNVKKFNVAQTWIICSKGQEIKVGQEPRGEGWGWWGRQAQERMNFCVLIADSFCCTAESNTIL